MRKNPWKRKYPKNLLLLLIYFLVFFSSFTSIPFNFDHIATNTNIDDQCYYPHENINHSVHCSSSDFQLTVIVKDVDFQIVKGAIVTLINQSAPIPEVMDGISDEFGEVMFKNISSGFYNITVSYSISAVLEEILYNSSSLGVEYGVFSLNTKVYLNVNLWTIDFKVQDFDNNDFSFAYINIINASSGVSLTNLSLEDSGKQKFVWLNQSSYKYEVYFNNTNYNLNEILIDEGIISRKLQNVNTSLVYINQTSSSILLNEYYLNTTFLVQGTNKTQNSYEIGYQSIISLNISLDDMDDNLSAVNVWYIDEDGVDEGFDNLIYSNNTYSSETTAFISLNLTGAYKAFGIRLEVLGENNSICNGSVTVSFSETQTEYLKLDIASKSIYVFDTVRKKPVSGVIIRVLNNSDLVVELVTNKNGYALDSKVNGNSFNFLKGTYTIELEFFDSRDYLFSVDGNPTSKTSTIVLETFSIINIEYMLDKSKFRILFRADYPKKIHWNENINIYVLFWYTINGGSTYNPMDNLARVDYYINKSDSSYIHHGVINYDENGVFVSEINSSILDADKFYQITLEGYKRSYFDPEPIIIDLEIEIIPTSLKLYNYSSESLTEIATHEVFQFYNLKINLTFSYHSDINPFDYLGNAQLRYVWIFGNGFINRDPLHQDYFSLEINTGIVPEIGMYQMNITAELDNYETQEYKVNIIVLPRLTSVNNKTGVIYENISVWIGDPLSIEYYFSDSIINEKIDDLDSAYYFWYKFDDHGVPISEISENQDLVKTKKGSYLIDFNSQTLDQGTYAIFVRFTKKFYESQNIVIHLNIKLRNIDLEIRVNNQEVNRIDVLKGEKINISIVLKDPTRSNTLITGAKVYLNLTELNKTFCLEEVSYGVYNYCIDTEQEFFQAFFGPQFLSGKLSIEKNTYAIKEVMLDTTIHMVEIFPGIPSFCFLLIIGFSVSLIGALITADLIKPINVLEIINRLKTLKRRIKSLKIK